MNAEAIQIDADRNNLVFTLLIVATLMMLCTFLFAFFVLDDIQTVPCDVNRAVGPQGPRGAASAPSPDNLKTGSPGLSPKAGFVRGPQGQPGLELTGPTGILSPLGTGWPGAPGDTGDKGGPPNLDGLTQPGLQFTGADQALLDFYVELELTVKASALTFTNKKADVPVVLIRMGSIVTFNIYPFLIFREAAKVGLQGLITLEIFNATLPLPEFAPPRPMDFGCIVSKFTITDSSGTTIVQEATQTNVDWGSALEITPGSGCVLYGSWSVFDPTTGSGPPDITNLNFKSADSPFGLEGVISASWLVD